MTPSLHVDYKRSRIKQYYKEGRALRTEPVINNTYDFAIGRRLSNLDDLKQVGFAANRRLLRVQRLSHDCPLGMETFEQLHRPAVVDERRVSALRFAHQRGNGLTPLAGGRRPVECTERDRHRYGRTVGVCRVAGADVNAWMVEQGWAVAYRCDTVAGPSQRGRQAGHLGNQAIV